jgi:integrase
MITLKAIDLYVDNVNQYMRSYPTCDKYIAKILKKSKLAYLRLSDVSVYDLEDYRDLRLTQVQPATAKKELCYLKRVFKHHHQAWFPTFQLPRNADREREEVPTKAELSLIIDSADAHLGAFIQVAAATAMRRSEIVNIRTHHIKDNTLQIPVTKTDRPRTIPISDKTKAIIFEQAGQGARPFSYHPSTYTHKFKKLCREIGLGQYVVHSLRHYGCSALFDAGLNMIQVSSISGHTDLKMLKRYTHIRPSTLVDMLPA